MPTAADIIATRLFAAGCRTAFGIPGGEVLDLIDALERAGIRFVLAKHENAAGFMAEGSHHATGAPGILVATIGPGIANAVNVIANAEQERVPLIVISGQVDPAEQLTYTHQVFDHAAVLGPLCKATFQAVAGACDVMIDKAIAIATDARPGPVHIDLPIAVAASEHKAPARIIRAKPSTSAPAPGPDLDRAQALFAAAQRPVIVAGLDCLDQPDAAAAIRAFSARFGVPVVTSYKAKGVLAEDDALALGGHGLSPKADAIILPFLGAADLIIAAGYDPIEMRAGWRDPWPAERAIEFVAAPNSHYMHQSALSWLASIAAGLAALAEGATPKPVWTDGAVALTRAALDTAFAAGPAWGPAAAFHAIREAAPRDTVVTVDSGAHRILASQIWRCFEPRGLLQSTGLCTMGCAVPLAAGYKLARPGLPVVAILGDACLDMTLGELTTLRDLGLPVVVVVMVDASLSLIELKQRRSGLQSVGVDFGRTDYAAVARALGGHGVSVGNTTELAEAMAHALAADRFTVIAVEIPRRAYDGLI